LAAKRHHHRALIAPGRTSHRGRALPGRLGRAALATLLSVASLATVSSASAEEVFTSQAAASNATDSTWIPAPTRRAAVCIVDTGTDTTPDTGNVVARFAMDGSDGSDISPVKHGTLMATIASAPKNDFGMVGATPSVDVVSVRASSDGTSFAGLDIQAAVQLCISKRNAYNIKAVSLSLGGDGSTITASITQRTEFQDTIDSARRYGLNVVAAAGNNERGVVDWPAGYAPAFAVGAATGLGARCSFASWGAAVDLWAPGCPLDVGRPDDTGASAWANGSSEATAFVAAVLAQMRGLDLALGVDDSEYVLRTGTRSTESGAFLDVGSAFRSTGLTAALAVGHSSIPSSTLAPSSVGIVDQTPKGEAPSSAPSTPNVALVTARQPTVVGPPATTTDRTLSRVTRPVVRAATVRRGLLALSLKRKPVGVEVWVEIYSRRRGKPFPSIAKRARFRADTLRIRVSGAISQLSIGYRDPTGVRKRSEVTVVHPRT
jgi:hypothetical protein